MNETSSKPRPLISVISPFYRAADCVDEFITRVEDAVVGVDPNYEIVLIEDGSPDATWASIEAACKDHPRVRAARLSRNFGQQAAILAGLQLACGDFVVIMDCDLENNPQYIPALYEKCTSGGHDVVYAKQDRRRHNALKNLNARVFYRLLSLISPLKMDPRLQNYSILRRPVVDAYLQSTRYEAAYLQTLHYLGFDQAEITVTNSPRYAGKTTYSFGKNIIHAVNITIAYSDRLLLLSAFAGGLFSLFAIFGIAITVFNYVAYGKPVVGWSSLMVTIMFFGGLILFSLGILGLYLGKVFDQTKQLPRYIISERRNFD